MNYSNIKIEPKILEVNSVSQYIDLVEDFKANNYYFRGESSEYPSRVASGLREVIFDGAPNGWMNNHYDIDFVLRDYYKNIGEHLSPAEELNFLGYAQHHGLVTSLLDISTNPLVGLYFASQNSKGDTGYIYIYNKNHSIDVSDFLRGTNYNNLSKKIINRQDYKYILNLANGLAKIKEKEIKSYSYYLFSLIKHIYAFANENDEYAYKMNNILKIDIDYISTLPDKEIVRDIECELFTTVETWFSDELKTLDSKKEQILEKDSPHIFDSLCYLIIYSEHLAFLNSKFFGPYEFHNLPLFPQMLYKPTYLFDRMRAQDGLFFYQLYLHKKEETYGSGVNVYQEIIPEKIVKINNKNGIKNSLDNIGVNRKILFPDPDNIAEYINEKERIRMAKTLDNKK